MPLSMNAPIDLDDIISVRNLAPGHPVYLLNGAQLSKLVVKREQVTLPAGRKEALRTNLQLMEAVDSDAQVVVLSGLEVQALTDFVQHEILVANVLNQAVPADLQALNTALGIGSGKWIKMPVKRLANLADAGQARLAGQKADVRAFAQALNAPGGLEKLGAIVAVDLFNDNNDRFTVSGGANFNGVTLNFLLNVGNVLLSSGNLSGLDSFDPNSPTRNTRGNLAALDPNGEWGGYLLGPAAAVTVNGHAVTLDQYGAGIIADLETVLGPRNHSLPGFRKQRLAPNAKARLLQGVTGAIPVIRGRLRAMPALPNLIQQKCTALNWVPV